MNEGALTVVSDIAAGAEPALRQLLDLIQEDISTGKLHRAQKPIIAFGDIESVHFARFVVLEPPAHDRDRPSRLILATNYEGPREQHVDELVEVAGAGLQQVFSHCEALKGDVPRTPRDLLEASVDPNAFYKGHRGRKVRQIRNEEFLRQELERELGNGGSKLARDPHAEVRSFCAGHEDLRWALKPPDPIRLSVLRKAWIFGLVGLVILLSLPALPVLVAAWLLALRALEKRDERMQAEVVASAGNWQQTLQDLAVSKRLKLDEEDRNFQNPLTVVTTVKQGWLRLLTLRVVLKGVDFLARTWFDKGSLGGIPTIHFARWFLVDDGEGRHRLVFFSNYDGSWESYLGRFVDSASPGLTAIWSNTEGFPKSRWLLGAGSRDEQRFKTWARSKGRTPEVWYSAYPDLGVGNVNNSSEIRRGLQGFRSLEDKLRWLRRL